MWKLAYKIAKIHKFHTVSLLKSTKRNGHSSYATSPATHPPREERHILAAETHLFHQPMCPGRDALVFNSFISGNPFLTQNDCTNEQKMGFSSSPFPPQQNHLWKFFFGDRDAIDSDTRSIICLPHLFFHIDDVATASFPSSIDTTPRKSGREMAIWCWDLRQTGVTHSCLCTFAEKDSDNQSNLSISPLPGRVYWTLLQPDALRKFDSDFNCYTKL